MGDSPCPSRPALAVMHVGCPAQRSAWSCSLSPMRAATGTAETSLLQLLVKNIQLEGGKMIPASHLFRGADSSTLELTEEELVTAEAVRVGTPVRAAAWVGRCLESTAWSQAVHPLPMYALTPGTAPAPPCLGAFWCAFPLLPLPLVPWGMASWVGLTLLGTHCQQWANEVKPLD